MLSLYGLEGIRTTVDILRPYYLHVIEPLLEWGLTECLGFDAIGHGNAIVPLK